MTSAGSASALLLIDVQQGFYDLSYWGPRNNPGPRPNYQALAPLHRDFAEVVTA